MLGNLNLFSIVSGLKPNLDKSEIAGIGVLKNVNVALCGMKSVNLMEQAIKILGVHISYNKKLQDNLNFQTIIKNICSILKVWQMRNLSLAGKITLFKSLAISKIVYLSFLTLLPNNIIEELKEIQKKNLWSDKKAKIKHDTLCNDYKDGGLKNVDIVHKINALKCSWLQRLYNDNFHEWKIIPLRYISLYLGKDFKFHSSLEITVNILDNFPSYYKNIIQCWIKNFSKSPTTPSAIASQYLWFNSNIKVDKKVVFYKEFSDNQINYLTDLFDLRGKKKSWIDLAIEFNLDNKLFFKWCQLIHALPKSWKTTIADDQGQYRSIVFLNHHLLKDRQIYSIEKLNSKELYSLSISLKNTIPSSRKYFENLFPGTSIVWKDVYRLPRLVTVNSTLRMFHFKILNNILYLN